jgi:hypothetical protein
MKEIKRFILTALLRLQGTPMQGDTLDTAIKQSLVPRPLQSDIERARHELEEGGFIIGTRDDLDGSVSWGLTAKGELKAKQL